MLADRKVADRAKRYLADAIGGALHIESQQFTVLDHFCTTEECPLRMLQRSFRGEAVVVVSKARLSAPRECRSRMPPGRDVICPESACRPARLVDSWFDLFGIDEMSPAALQREGWRRIP